MRIDIFKTSTLAVIVTALVIFGSAACGGGSGSSSSGGSDNGGTTSSSISLKASETTIDPGQTVDLSWTSKNVSRIEDSNFGATTVVGSATVTPNATTIYSITGLGEEGNITSTVTITVDNPRRRFIIVGNANNPEITGVQNALNAIGNTAVQQTVPSNTGSYDCMVIHLSGNIGPSDNSTIQSALAAGKGVVVLCLAPSKIATGVDSLEKYSTVDTTAVASWFGGVTRMLQNSTYGFSQPNNAYFALPPSVPANRNSWYSNQGADYDLMTVESGQISSTGYRTLGNEDDALAFAFRTPSGGKVYWQWDYDGNNASVQDKVTALFKAAALWAANP